MVAPTAVCRGDEGTPIDISALSNLQDDVIPINIVLRTDGQFGFVETIIANDILQIIIEQTIQIC
jgi:carbonic anhydrase/acetyltransferase-like protein (isoleucine patch superfamily)